MSIVVPTITDLRGALQRDAGGWRWADGEPEPRVRDLRLEDIAPEWRCICRGRFAWVEIPADWRSMVRHDELVRAVTELVRDYAVVGSIDDTAAAAIVGPRGHRRSGYRVPLEAWRLLMRQPIGATWKTADDEAIRARARRLGFVEPLIPGFSGTV